MYMSIQTIKSNHFTPHFCFLLTNISANGTQVMFRYMNKRNFWSDSTSDQNIGNNILNTAKYKVSISLELYAIGNKRSEELTLIRVARSENFFFFSGQEKIRGFLFWSGNVKILLKVREKSGNFEKRTTRSQYHSIYQMWCQLLTSTSIAI